jgi:hypothetical protein
MLRKLKYCRFNFLKINSKKISGYYHTIQKSSSKIEQEAKVDVYEGPEWQEVNGLLSRNNYFDIIPNSLDNVNKLQNLWEECVFSTKFKPKYFSLIPFHIEDRNSFHSKKKFVLKMELYPDNKYLKFTCAMIGGIYL